MDASVIYPGYAMGLPTIKDTELRLACFRAYNDWLADDFAARRPAPHRRAGDAPG